MGLHDKDSADNHPPNTLNRMVMSMEMSIFVIIVIDI